VAETPGKVLRIDPAEPGLVQEQIELLLRNFPVAAIKTGLLCNAALVSVVAGVLRKAKPRNLVVDPVMIATSGDALLEPEAVVVYENELFPLATLITPNLDEAARLLGEKIRDLPSVHRVAKALARNYRTAVLLKGGHLRGTRAVDVFSDGNSTREFSSTFIPNVKTHGTGCAYSAAITAGLAQGLDLCRAIAAAKRFVSLAIRSRCIWKKSGREVVALNL
jgi:hydroxymethylpyrimidine/phosphomethylpyrimidine kinase